MEDFRDHHIKKALDETIGAWRPEGDSRSRLKRIAAVVALTAVAVAAFWTILYFSSPRHSARPPAAAKPIPIELLPAPAKR